MFSFSAVRGPNTTGAGLMSRRAGETSFLYDTPTITPLPTVFGSAALSPACILLTGIEAKGAAMPPAPF